MRLWSEQLINKLPRQQLLGQHRECCALRGNGWGKKHSVVNYVFKYNIVKLFRYHKLIMEEMNNRGYKVSEEWENPQYRGKNLEPMLFNEFAIYNQDLFYDYKDRPIYKEHDKEYLKECLNNLKEKDIDLGNVEDYKVKEKYVDCGHNEVHTVIHTHSDNTVCSDGYMSPNQKVIEDNSDGFIVLCNDEFKTVDKIPIETFYHKLHQFDKRRLAGTTPLLVYTGTNI